MKILYQSNVPAPYRVTFFNLLSKEHDVTVLFDTNNNEKRNDKWYKSNIFKFKQIWLKKFPLFQLIKIFNVKYDIIVMGNYASFSGAIIHFICKFKKIKYILNADGGFAGNDNILSKYLKTYFISGASYWLSSGNETDKYLIHYGADSTKIYHYPMSSLLKKDIISENLSFKNKKKLREKYNFDDSKTFISVGSYIYRKGFDIILDVLTNNDFSDSNFIFIGGGELKKEYEDFIVNNNINNVRMLDFLDKDILLDYYKLSDAFIIPSREDIWGLVVNEAAACGLPIISSNKTLSSIELLDKKYIFDININSELCSLLKLFSNMNRDELKKIGDRNLETISMYTIENMTDIHLKIFKEILSIEK